MKTIKRLTALLLALLCCTSSALAASKKNKKNQENTPREITTEVIEEVPAKIQDLLDLAYAEWQETAGAELKRSNKYTKWRTNTDIGWCAAFTWCMLQLEVPQKAKNDTPREDASGIVHVKEAGVGKVYTGYEHMNRLTMVPQKGFIAVFGNGKKFGDVGATPYYHVGLVYDVEKLSEGKYRITTIEGAVNYPGDKEHRRVGNTIRMYVRDYDMNAEKSSKDLSLVPEDERTEEESPVFSYDYTYGNQNLYITVFLMPWDPEEELPAGE